MLNVNLRYILLFVVVFTTFEYLYFLSRDTVIEKLLVDYITVIPSASIISFFSGLTVIPIEHRLVSNEVRLSVLNGCEGTETIIIFISALLAYKASWQYKLIGAILGTIFIYLLNQMRIYILFTILPINQDFFHLIHAYIGPTVILIASLCFFAVWVKLNPKYFNSNEHIY